MRTLVIYGTLKWEKVDNLTASEIEHFIYKR